MAARRRPELLPPSFYARDALEVARDLLGKHITHAGVTVRITEVEAYRWPDDTANHCRAGRTARNAPMWGPPGHAYVYLCYGMHQMLNLVTNAEGEGAAVLIRAAEPVEGVERVLERRGMTTVAPALLDGPGKVGQALGLTTADSGRPLFVKGGLEVREGAAVTRVLAGPRIGVDYASPNDRDAPWRLADADSPWVGHRKRLRLA